MWLFPFIKGAGVGGSLIMAIGAQNAFVLSNAIRGQHAMIIAAVCIVIDIILIFSGVWGLGALIQNHPDLLALATYAGALFLLAYGGIAFHRAWKPAALEVAAVTSMTIGGAIVTTAALSLLNPHVYLDTVILLGSIGAQLPDNGPWWFALGASVASLLWFMTLAWGGALLAPWFGSKKSWQRLDLVVGITMWLIALWLLCSV